MNGLIFLPFLFVKKTILRIRGGEPIEFPHEFQMQANCITFTDIHVSLYHAFPPSFRQFEKRYCISLIEFLISITQH